MAPDHDDDGLLVEIYQAVTPSLQVGPEQRPFRPWHKPRKHVIRLRQWCAAVRALIKKLGLKKGDVLSYLGLPGEDFLDVRCMKSVCDEAGVRIRYLGFDATADFDGENEMNLSRHEVASLGFVDPFSLVLKDRFQSIASVKSPGHLRSVKLAPFDVVNLDLCNSVGASAGANSYFDAVHRLCDIQTRFGARPWLLFLTTRVERNQIDDDVRLGLLKCINDNVLGSADFRSGLEAKLGLSRDALEREARAEALLAHADLVRMFGLGLAKWFLRIMMGAEPEFGVSLLDSYCYCVHGDEPDMLSLAFSFDPIVTPRIDEIGLGNSELQSDGPRPSNGDLEKKMAMDLLDGIGGIKDVDEMLRADGELREKMTMKTAELLSSVRYDRDKYLQWAKDK